MTQYCNLSQKVPNSPLFNINPIRIRTALRDKLFIFPQGDSFAATTSVAIGRRDVESSQVRSKTKFSNEAERKGGGISFSQPSLSTCQS